MLTRTIETPQQPENQSATQCLNIECKGLNKLKNDPNSYIPEPMICAALLVTTTFRTGLCVEPPPTPVVGGGCWAIPTQQGLEMPLPRAADSFELFLS